MVDEVYELADAGEEGELGVGGGAALLVQIVVILAKEQDVLRGIAQITVKQKIMALNVVGEICERFDVWRRRQATRIEHDKIVFVRGNVFAHYKIWCGLVFDAGEEVLHVDAVVGGSGDDEDAGRWSCLTVVDWFPIAIPNSRFSAKSSCHQSLHKPDF